VLPKALPVITGVQSRPNRDAVPMMPWSGLSLDSAEHANEMGTSELPHWTSIMMAAIALTTDRSMNPG